MDNSTKASYDKIGSQIDFNRLHQSLVLTNIYSIERKKNPYSCIIFNKSLRCHCSTGKDRKYGSSGGSDTALNPLYQKLLAGI